ncbi:DUF998 domain-containing protein [Ginsengibacter hankyongi]|uniref:DUF998 domain-containing protein n=1 Tax=Ginsengibacter hankyongi TaxID=2607284 RepID=A0A5J5IDH7_9BACT|nr:DUF998 domain-containing protein [Ginsengibacter hankyongi]KAA9036320.1 DUF998 domain-containing protein [Ginsengibacter hankyongi]
MTRKVLLICGIVSMLWYVAINIIVPMQYPGYNIASQTVSELSAIHAPTRAFWSELCLIYILLFIAFGFGTWLSANGNRKLRIVAAVIIFDAVFGLFWPPMHKREVLAAGGGTLTDTLHIVWAFVHLVLMLLMIGFGAASFGKAFRVFSVGIVLVFIVFGILTTKESFGLEAGLPTPHVGVWERVNMGAYMLWVVVFTILLIRRNNKPARL